MINTCMKLHSLFENIEYNAFNKYIQKKYGVRAFWIIESGDDIELNSIIVAKEDQKKGTGTEIMNELIRFADAKHKRITLSVGVKDDIHGTTSRSRLVKFYKRFGFKENKGSKKDFTVSAGMIRSPR